VKGADGRQRKSADSGEKPYRTSLGNLPYQGSLEQKVKRKEVLGGVAYFRVNPQGRCREQEKWKKYNKEPRKKTEEQSGNNFGPGWFHIVQKYLRSKKYRGKER